MPEARRYKAGDSIEDYCRACKTDRLHTVIVADGDGQPIRVACGYCDSEHNYRGGPRISPSSGPAAASAASAWTTSPAGASTGRGGQRPAVPRARPAGEPFPIVSERERTCPPMSDQSGVDLEMLLRRVIREETGITAVMPAERWRGGTLILKPGNATQERSWPIETFFHKIVMLRNRLRTLEQQVNAADLPEDIKIRLQGYVSGCYGSLTSFNVLFADEDDQFKGSGGSE
jgi:hypothetical protein